MRNIFRRREYFVSFIYNNGRGIVCSDIIITKNKYGKLASRHIEVIRQEIRDAEKLTKDDGVTIINIFEL